MEYAKGGLHWCNGPVAIESLMRVLGMSREQAEKAVLDAGGSPADPVPGRIRKEWKPGAVSPRSILSRTCRPCRIRGASRARRTKVTLLIGFTSSISSIGRFSGPRFCVLC